jgi:hypothetical protein
MSDPSTREPARIRREKRTMRAMIALYCRGHHKAGGAPCVECQSLYDYAVCRLDRCPFGSEKPTCGRCPIHCYKPAMRERVKEVMRYAGPRMLLRHPVLALLHQFDALRRPRE